MVNKVRFGSKLRATEAGSCRVEFGVVLTSRLEKYDLKSEKRLRFFLDYDYFGFCSIIEV